MLHLHVCCSAFKQTDYFLRALVASIELVDGRFVAGHAHVCIVHLSDYVSLGLSHVMHPHGLLASISILRVWVVWQVTCMHVDQSGAMLWTGHADGRVSGFWLGSPPGAAINNRRMHHWQVGFLAFHHLMQTWCAWLIMPIE